MGALGERTKALEAGERCNFLGGEILAVLREVTLEKEGWRRGRGGRQGWRKSSGR